MRFNVKLMYEIGYLSQVSNLVLSLYLYLKVDDNIFISLKLQVKNR